MEKVLFICILFTGAVATQNMLPTTQGQTSSRPHLTGCFSRDMITFRCQWDTGSFQNHTELEDLSFFYMLEKDPKKTYGKWIECPSYNSLRNECYFDASHTFVWYTYVIQLRSVENVYEEMSFNIENIVFPDPPVRLNWTLLKMASSGLHCDVVLSWDPPPSAGVPLSDGWISLVYETQYREKDSDQWNTLENDKNTQAFIYGLESNTEYELRVRAKMRGFHFGDFSDSILILVPNKERHGLLKSVKSLQNTIQQQCDLRAENERLKNAALQMKKENEAQLEESKIQLQRLTAEMKVLRDQHQRELEDCDKETQRKLKAKDTELKVAHQRYECTLEEMRRQMTEKEKEKQTQIIKLQMEFGAKLARAQSMSAKTQTQTQASAPRPQNIFKRKLQFIQEEKNKEIEALRQRVRELEHHSLHGLKRRRN